MPIAKERAQMPARTQRVVAPIRGQSRAIVTKVATTSSGTDWKISEKGEREIAGRVRLALARGKLGGQAGV
jgi:hypothetical protein